LGWNVFFFGCHRGLQQSDRMRARRAWANPGEPTDAGQATGDVEVSPNGVGLGQRPVAFAFVWSPHCGQKPLAFLSRTKGRHGQLEHDGVGTRGAEAMVQSVIG